MKSLKESTLTLGVLFTISLVANALLLRQLGLESYPANASLAIRGMTCLVIALLFSVYKKQTLKPKKPMFQIFRATLAAFSLLAIIASYHYIHASTVTLLQRLDLLVLCLLGLHASTRKGTHLHVVAIVGCFALVTYLLKDSSEKPIGYVLASLGAIGIAMGYIMMKKSESAENFSITIAVPALSSVLLGVLIDSRGFFEAIRNPLGLLAIGSGVFMFASYYLTLKLYQRMNMATAEFPTLLAATLVMPLESLVFGRELHAAIFLFDTAIVLWLSWVLGVPQHFLKGTRYEVSQTPQASQL